MTTTAQTNIHRYQAGVFVAVEDAVATEEPLEIRIEGETLAIVMRTPGNDRELVAGFLFTEGIVQGVDDLFDITTCVEASVAGKGNTIDVALRDPSTWKRAEHTRSGVSSASCGVCGKQSIEAVLQKREPVRSVLIVTAELLLQLPPKLAGEQAGFARSGGLHACALFTGAGELLLVREDIGRHNALDKLIGWALLTGYGQMAECIVLLSGRVSFEMMQKTQAAGISVVAAISAPSTLAVNLAHESGQTLIGFLRGGTMNVYAGAERVIGSVN